jgi:hypothetical protein
VLVTEVADDEAIADESTASANLATESGRRGVLATESGDDVLLPLSKFNSTFAASQFAEICLEKAARECGSWGALT